MKMFQTYIMPMIRALIDKYLTEYSHYVGAEERRRVLYLFYEWLYAQIQKGEL